MGSSILPPTDLIAAPLSSILQPLCDQLADLCQCLRDTAQQPGVHPREQFPFIFRGSVSQTFQCHIATFVFQVPQGHTGVITRVSLWERYPGTLYGANFMILINDNLAPEFPRIDHPTGEDGISTSICLQEQDIVSVLIQCNWQPVNFDGIATTYVQTIFPFSLEGYFEYMDVPAAQDQPADTAYATTPSQPAPAASTDVTDTQTNTNPMVVTSPILFG